MGYWLRQRHIELTPNFITTASFSGAPAGIAPFFIATSVDTFVAYLAAGLDLIGTDGMVLRLRYNARFGEMTEQHSGTAKLTVSH